MTEIRELVGNVDQFGGIIVDVQQLPEDPEIFETILQASLKTWSAAGRRGIWLTLPIDKAAFVPIAVAAGFVFHHAKSDYVMMIHWLPTTQPCTLPNYAAFYCGVGGLVINDNNEVLVIKEKNGPARNIWKIPGGAVDPGEELFEAAVREVLEETGIECEFESLLCFRQAPNYSFGLADLYFVAKLKPRTLEINMQTSEVADCRWMPADEFFSLPYYKGLYGYMMSIEKEAAAGRYPGLRRDCLPIGFRPGHNNLYHACTTALPKL
eukprot:TRINITY_DN11116_c0_g1_i1.p1 TRINITY_DN11116_c0_g1~~TRINITY_DN11116_c0_g1_i1.p1  ORF type:complete len:266 (+),score=77.86 TRINITY_DN11116_c0_g1_i1:102-899(+)